VKRAKSGGEGAATAAAPALERNGGRIEAPSDPAQAGAEAAGWFTVSRAAQLLALPLPRVFDAIRDGRLQVRFEAGKPGESDKPLVTSAELREKAPASPLPTAAPQSQSQQPPQAPPSVPATHGANGANGASASRPQPPPASLSAPFPSPANAESPRLIAELRAELESTSATLDEAEQQLDAALKTVYERDVRIARLEAEVAAHAKMREGNDTFIRHLESRLDKTEERSEEKEKEIRRLAVGLGEARGEIRLLKPPEAPPPSPWRRHLAGAAFFVLALAGAAAVGYFTHRLAGSGLRAEAAGVAAAGVVLAWSAATLVERLRKAK